jgi:hypothetical protein
VPLSVWSFIQRFMVSNPVWGPRDAAYVMQSVAMANRCRLAILK